MTIFDFFERFILFIIPGSILYTLFHYLTGKQIRTDTFNILYIFIASLTSFLFGNLFLCVLTLLPCFDFAVVQVTQILSGNTSSLTISGMVAAIVASLLLTFVLVFIWEKNLLFKFMNKLKISHKVDNHDVWDYMFDSQPWVVVRDYVTGNTYYGGVIRYSDNNSQKEILLKDVKVWSIKDGEYHMETVYLSRLPSEFSIETDNYNKGENNE